MRRGSVMIMTILPVALIEAVHPSRCEGAERLRKPGNTPGTARSILDQAGGAQHLEVVRTRIGWLTSIPADMLAERTPRRRRGWPPR